jgi:phage terminase small subunit
MTPKQQLFVAEYRVLRNASEAARRAGYSPRSAGAIGRQMLRRPAVIAALREAGVEIVPGINPPGQWRRPPPPRPRADLTVLEQRFVEEYLVDGNATHAAIRARLRTRNPAFAGNKMLRRPRVARAIERERLQSAARTRIDHERILREFARIAFAEIGDIADWDADGFVLKPKAEIAKDDRAAVQEIALRGGKKGPRARIRMHSKIQALDVLGKHLGLWGTGARTIADQAGDKLIDGRDPREVLRERFLRMVAEAAEKAKAG